MNELQRRLLGLASRRPWRVEDRGWADGSQVIRCGDGDHDGFDHHSKENAELIVTAVNEYEPLLGCELVLREFRHHIVHPTALGLANDALRRVEEARQSA